MYRIFLCLFMFIGMSGYTHAQSAIVNKVLEQLNLKLSDCKEELICEKALPDRPGCSVVVIPKIASGDEDVFSLDSYILLVDSSGKIMSQYFEDHETNGWESDAVRLDHISVDTAPYNVKKGVRAFGVGLGFIGSSNANPYNSGKLWLFVQDGMQLKCILFQFEVMRYNGEWDTSCAGVSTTEDKAIKIGNSVSNGYFDLIITNKITHARTKVVGDDCKEQRTQRVKRTLLKFDKHTYR